MDDDVAWPGARVGVVIAKLGCGGGGLSWEMGFGAFATGVAAGLRDIETIAGSSKAGFETGVGGAYGRENGCAGGSGGAVKFCGRPWG